ncbi:MAG: hypothetical protein JWR57_769 [Mycetocola sp.]|jgi:hypothetical protein|nr:hypothetical protein [Mycetocola sp.]
MLRGSVAILACLLGCAALTGCSPAATPAPSPTSTAIFASEDEALAAATAVYQQYSAALDKVFAAGGQGDESLRDFVTPEYLVELGKDGALEKNGWRTTGVTSFDNISVSELADTGKSATITLALCRDVADVRFVDAGGTDVTPETRMERFPVLVTFETELGGLDGLKISESDSWPGEDFCH